jgi:hypothetical protein
MGKYSYYDATLDVVFVDLSGLNPNRDMWDEIMSDIHASLDTLCHQVYIVSCWREVQMDLTSAQYYGECAKELLKRVKGIARHSATEPLTRINLISEAIKHEMQGSRSHIYNDKAEALKAIRAGKI